MVLALNTPATILVIGKKEKKITVSQLLFKKNVYKFQKHMPKDVPPVSEVSGRSLLEITKCMLYCLFYQ